MRRLMTALLAVVCLLLVHGLLDKYAIHTEERIAYARWVHKNCLPTHRDDRAVARFDADGHLRCVIFSGVGYAKVARPVSVATLEVPQ